jgi:putative transposase
MPRTARASVGGICYHVINRGNAQARVYGDQADYEVFVELIARACQRVPMRVLGYCLMPNHFHLVVWPHDDGDLSRWMQWLLTAHVRRHHRRRQTGGHVWGGRFKAFPIQRDNHLLTVLRYVERNPLRAELVRQAEDWAWSSLRWWRREGPAFLHPGPVERPRDWLQLVNQPLAQAELASIRRSVNRGTPCGSELWVQRIAKRLDLESALRPRGRPKKD